MSDYLPKELMIEIFLRLPIKSIIRCTSCCKSWYSFLTSPNFISMHLNRKQNDHILIRGNGIYDLFSHDKNLNPYAQFDLPFKSTGTSYFDIVGSSCNGILCLVDGLMCYYFWNPSIRKSFKLPKPIHTFQAFEYTVGFGFDSVTNDYKVVRIIHTPLYSQPPRVDLFKLSTGVWEDISHVCLPYLFLSTTPQVYVKGASHSIGFKWKERYSIVLFDMHDETFSEMLLPSNLTKDLVQHYETMFLFVSEESLCLVDNNCDKDERIDIWMMREYGVQDSWVKQFSIESCNFAPNSPLPYDIFWKPYTRRSAQNELGITNDLMKPIAIKKNGEILWKANRRLLVLVDRVVEKFKDLDNGNPTIDWCHNPRYLKYYKESLVLPDKWTNNCVGDACEESLDLWKREPKDGRRKLLRAKTKNRMRIASLLHMSGLLYMSKMKGKWLRKKNRMNMQIKKPSLSNSCVAREALELRSRLIL